ncbi:hypothetical protein [Methanosarcina barkeri]|uniref:hypothetical protein n=1 Tax=Methanosarcina barkeri TaxID=2208 RepID=UPI001FB3BD77|nr:hypothetical protein [Methanosarcina barkeri]
MVDVCPRVHVVFFVNKVFKALFPEDRVHFFPDLGVGIQGFTGFLIYGITG